MAEALVTQVHRPGEGGSSHVGGGSGGSGGAGGTIYAQAPHAGYSHGGQFQGYTDYDDGGHHHAAHATDESDEEDDKIFERKNTFYPTHHKRSLLRRLFGPCCKCFFKGEHGDESEFEIAKREALEAASDYCLPPQSTSDMGKKTLVLDLDETLVHSSFKPIPNPDFIIPIEIEGQEYQVYVAKRPGVDQFLDETARHFEMVIFTASLAKYADPLLDLLDKGKVCPYRLFRESCEQHEGNYVKDLSRLGRDLSKIIIIDNSPCSYIFQPGNALPITSWFDDMRDRELLQLLPALRKLAKCDDVVECLKTLRASRPLM